MLAQVDRPITPMLSGPNRGHDGTLLGLAGSHRRNWGRTRHDRWSNPAPPEQCLFERAPLRQPFAGRTVPIATGGWFPPSRRSDRVVAKVYKKRCSSTGRADAQRFKASGSEPGSVVSSRAPPGPSHHLDAFLPEPALIASLPGWVCGRAPPGPSTHS